MPRAAPVHTPSPRLVSLAAPLLLERLLAMGVGIAGTVLSARLSDASGAGFALAHQLVGARGSLTLALAARSGRV
jgi:hypothetical protein